MSDAATHGHFVWYDLISPDPDGVGHLFRPDAPQWHSRQPDGTGQAGQRQPAANDVDPESESASAGHSGGIAVPAGGHDWP